MINVKGGILLRARSGSVCVFPAAMKRAPDSDLRLIVGDEFTSSGAMDITNGGAPCGSIA